MAATPEELAKFLADLGIATTTVNHPPVFTVEEAQTVRGRIAGAHTKNLFLKDKKDQIFLVVAPEEARIDLKRLHEKIGATGRLSFGKPELLMETLGVVPGSVTAFGVINDQPPRVKVVLDASFMDEATINCHPLVNTATTTLAIADLLTFFRATGHEPRIIPLPESPSSPQL